jgi:haloacetate dehalogenase
MDWFDGFEARHHTLADGTRIVARCGGACDAPPLLLLHGFPQSHAMWHRVARRLAERFRLVLPDLRGYGDSDKPPGAADHANYSKRAMAADMAALMRALGHERFGLVGHDRGGRVAHRLALDHRARVSRLALIDIGPTLDMYAATDMRFASAYYHWFHLIQPQPLPERMIGGDAKFYLRWKLGGWGGTGRDPQDAGASAPQGGVSALGRPGVGRLDFIEPEALAEYERTFCTPEGIHAACEDYRASAGIDLEHDRASRAAGERIGCPLLVLWGARGVVEKLFDPLALWRAQCSAEVIGHAMPAGHFIPEELPEETARALGDFFT